jgi:hypothetical protein
VAVGIYRLVCKYTGTGRGFVLTQKLVCIYRLGIRDYLYSVRV